MELPASVPYRLDATLYTNGPQNADASLHFSFYLCRIDLKLAESSTMMLSNLLSLMTRSCHQIGVSPTLKQKQTSHSFVAAHKMALDISDYEVGLDLRLDSNTYPFCWKRAQVIAILYTDLTKTIQVRITFHLIFFQSRYLSVF